MFDKDKSTFNPRGIFTMNSNCCVLFPDSIIQISFLRLSQNDCCLDDIRRTRDLPKSIFGPGSTFKNAQGNALSQAVNRVSPNSRPLASGFPLIKGIFNGGSRVR